MIPEVKNLYLRMVLGSSISAPSLLAVLAKLSIPVLCIVRLQLMLFRQEETNEIMSLSDTGVAQHQVSAVSLQSFHMVHNPGWSPLLQVCFPHSTCQKIPSGF